MGACLGAVTTRCKGRAVLMRAPSTVRAAARAAGRTVRLAALAFVRKTHFWLISGSCPSSGIPAAADAPQRLSSPAPRRRPRQPCAPAPYWAFSSRVALWLTICACRNKCSCECLQTFVRHAHPPMYTHRTRTNAACTSAHDADRGPHPFIDTNLALHSWARPLPYAPFVVPKERRTNRGNKAKREVSLETCWRQASSRWSNSVSKLLIAERRSVS